MDGFKEYKYDISSLLNDFFEKDDTASLVADAGTILNCPILLIDDTFHIQEYYKPQGFTDEVFANAVKQGEITYEAGAIISRNAAISTGNADFIQLPDSRFQRRFAPLICKGIRFGYMICVDTDGHLQNIDAQIYKCIEKVIAKQLFIEAGKQDLPFETAEEILIHLLDGGFPSASYFNLQASSTYLSDFHPEVFALIDISAYHATHLEKSLLKDELTYHFYESHPFLYKGNAFLFLFRGYDKNIFIDLAKKFRLKVVISDKITELYNLPNLYQTAKEALNIITDKDFHAGDVYDVSNLKTLIMLSKLKSRKDLLSDKILALRKFDNEKCGQLCETLYNYLICDRSLKKTQEIMFTHRNTVLYRIKKAEEDFSIPINDETEHLNLILNLALVLFDDLGMDFFVEK